MARTRTRTDNHDNNEEKKAVVSDRRRRTRSETDDNAATENSISTRKDRPTPSARQARRGGAPTGLLDRIPVVRGIVGYLRGVASEMQKVTWPSREEATRLTGVVLGVTIAFAIVLGLLDTFFGWWFQQAFSPDSETIFLGIAAAVFVLAGGGFFALRNRI